MMVEDDIARLVRQHAEETAENERAHQERLADIKKQAQEQGGSYGSGVKNSALPQFEDMSKKIQDEYKKQSQVAKIEGGNAGGNWITELFRRGAEEASRVRERLQKAGASAPGMWGDLLKAFEVIGKGAAHGGLVPGAIDQPVPMVLHGGERVVPRTGVDVNSGGGISGGVSINMYGAVSMRSDQDIRLLADEIMRQIGRRNELERLGVGL